MVFYQGSNISIKGLRASIEKENGEVPLRIIGKRGVAIGLMYTPRELMYKVTFTISTIGGLF